ncbi:hypothetical protein JCM15765_03550 [Paradesulfitobacterium aromaticivorans]
MTIAREEGLREDWLNDGVKGFFYGNPPQVLWAEYPVFWLFGLLGIYLIFIILGTKMGVLMLLNTFLVYH